MDSNIRIQLYHVQKKDDFIIFFFFNWLNLPHKPHTPTLTLLNRAGRKLNLSINDIQITPGLNDLLVFKYSMNSIN